MSNIFQKIARPGGDYARVWASDVNKIIAALKSLIPNPSTPTAITASVISEATSGSGVTIAGAVLRNGGYVRSTQTGITAHAGGGQASAFQLAAEYVQIATVATTADSVKLPVGKAGMIVVVVNDGANSANVYPATGEYINAAQNTANAQAAGTIKSYYCITDGHWKV